MDDLVEAVFMTAAVPGLLFGLYAGIRSGFPWFIFSAIVGLIGGVVGGMAAPAVVGALNIPTTDGPITVVVGSIIGAILLLWATSGIRKVA